MKIITVENSTTVQTKVNRNQYFFLNIQHNLSIENISQISFFNHALYFDMLNLTMFDT